MESDMVLYSDDTTLTAVILSPAQRHEIAHKICRDIGKIHAWCEQWGMKLNPSKSRSLVISRSSTDLPRHPDLLVGGILFLDCLLYTSPSPRDGLLSRMPSSA